MIVHDPSLIPQYQGVSSGLYQDRGYQPEHDDIGQLEFQPATLHMYARSTITNDHPHIHEVNQQGLRHRRQQGLRHRRPQCLTTDPEAVQHCKIGANETSAISVQRKAQRSLIVRIRN